MKNKLSKLLVIIVLGLTLPLLSAYSTATPKTRYRVYLHGESIGLIKSKTELDEVCKSAQSI